MARLQPTHRSPWNAIYVKPRHEKNVANHLRGKGFDPFVPTYKSQRARSSELPLFPCYVFCRVDPENRLPILTVPCVFFIVGIGKTPAAIEESEVAALKTVVASGCRVQPWQYMKAGDRVRIDGGPLRGVEGFFQRTHAESQLIVSVTLLQRSVAVRLESNWVI